jgi:Fur family transcriptional regulator, ferric uptake regulator
VMNPALGAEHTLQLLQQRGHRLTGPRRRVVEAAQRQSGPFTADELLQQLQDDLPRVGRATIFRTLDLLAQNNVLDRLHRPDGCHSYVVATPGDPHHHHLICSACGVVVQFEDCTVEPLLAELSDRTQFSISGHWLEVFGLCAACQR